MTLPTPDQIKNCALMGWKYSGDGIFSKGDLIGWFEGREFKKA